MIDIGPDLTPAERQIAVVISRADRMLATAVSATLEKAIEQAAMTCGQSAKKTAPRFCNILQASFISKCIV